MKVLVGLSGGVDSSVAALLLKRAGHDIIGVTMSIWGKDGLALNSGHKNACYGPDEKEDIEEARKIAKQLDIPYYVFDCASKYEEVVLENFKKEYISGRTPNPCVWCNALVKFGLLPELAKLNGLKFDKFATGHYARIEKNETGRFILKRGILPKKDQSYFLYRLPKERLEHILLPLGEYTKDEIRKIAKEAGLAAAEKPDSQDFYGGDYNELLNIPEKEGNIVNTEGKILGKHKGIWNYTIGQRKGLGVSSTEALYVIELRKETNEVVVGFADKTFKDTLFAVDLNWLSTDKPENPLRVKAKIRSTGEPSDATIYPEKSGVRVVFDNMQKSIAAGQSVVFYDDDIVLGGGIIEFTAD